MDCQTAIDDKSSPFIYQHVLGEMDIRVLVLHPAPCFNDPLEIHLEIQSLPQLDIVTKIYPEPYEAVSYCWGSPIFQTHLLCEGKPLGITRSVGTLLRYLRKTVRHRRLWVDAVCINQQDEKEKGGQISLMGRIFGGAIKVHAWLGEAQDEDNIPTLFSLINAITVKDSFQTSNASPILVKPYATSFDRLLSRPWFSRRWILQEIVFGRHIVITCGLHKIPWSLFEEGLSVYRKFVQKWSPGPRHEALTTLEVVTTIDRTKLDIATLLWKCHASICKEPKDRVMALFAMATKKVCFEYSNEGPRATNQALQALDYTQDWIKCYTALARALLDDGNLDLIMTHLIAFGSLNQQNVDGPSWVPAWNNNRSVYDQSNLATYDPSESFQLSSDELAKDHRTWKTRADVCKLIWPSEQISSQPLKSQKNAMYHIYCMASSSFSFDLGEQEQKEGLTKHEAVRLLVLSDLISKVILNSSLFRDIYYSELPKCSINDCRSQYALMIADDIKSMITQEKDSIYTHDFSNDSSIIPPTEYATKCRRFSKVNEGNLPWSNIFLPRYEVKEPVAFIKLQRRNIGTMLEGLKFVFVRPVDRSNTIFPAFVPINARPGDQIMTREECPSCVSYEQLLVRPVEFSVKEDMRAFRLVGPYYQSTRSWPSSLDKASGNLILKLEDGLCDKDVYLV